MNRCSRWLIQGMASRIRSKKMQGIFIAAWIGVLGWGTRSLMVFDRTPGQSGPVFTKWPSTAPLRLGRLIPTLLLFAHAKCTCSGASLDELAQIMVRSQGRVEAHVFLYRPVASGWLEGALWHKAQAIPGVQVSWDEGGIEARRFSAFTSGDTLLWSPTGELWFRGGLTQARGQAGDNPGRSAILSWLLTGSAPMKQTPVFGCPVSISGNSASPGEVLR